MTILVSDLSDTVVAKFKKWSNTVADFTLLPKRGIWQPFVNKLPWLQQRLESSKLQHRIRSGFSTADPDSISSVPTNDDANDNDTDAADIEAATDTQQATSPTLPHLAAEAETDLTHSPTHASLSRRLALSIHKVSLDLRLERPKRYAYEEWVEFTRLIRYTTPRRLNRGLGAAVEGVDYGIADDEEEGLVNWDWLGEHSPMVSGVSESEWLIERLCESLVRLERHREVLADPHQVGGGGVGVKDGVGLLGDGSAARSLHVDTPSFG